MIGALLNVLLSTLRAQEGCRSSLVRISISALLAHARLGATLIDYSVSGDIRPAKFLGTESSYDVVLLYFTLAPDRKIQLRPTRSEKRQQ